MLESQNRESVSDDPNRLDTAGIEFIEYSTDRPQALGQVLECMGFQPVARHRSREVILYRQGEMNLIVNTVTATTDTKTKTQCPRISAVAFRVQNAQLALQRCLEMGAWEVPSQATAMELHIPGILGPDNSHLYFVDRWQDFSIYDIDFTPIPSAEQQPLALSTMHYFGVVQYVDDYRTADWLSFYQRMFNFVPVPDDERFGVMPNGALMRSACGEFLWQLVAPLPWQESDTPVECLRRIGIGVPDVYEAVSLLKARGVEFVESEQLHAGDRGALTRGELGGVAFELVHQDA